MWGPDLPPSGTEGPWIPKNCNRSRCSTSAVSSPRRESYRQPASIRTSIRSPNRKTPSWSSTGRSGSCSGSNNYLGLTHHPKVLEAASRALSRYGSGCTGSRFLNGTLDLHEQLESALAEFLGKEACLVFSTGYSANLGLISGLVGRGEVVYLDKLDHASIVDGAKLSYGETERFNHGDLANLERRLERNGGPGAR